MHPITQMVRVIVECLVRSDELEGVTEAQQPGMLRVDVRLRGRRAAGSVIGQTGETVRAIRHLVQRVGKMSRPPILTAVEVANGEEQQGVDTTAVRLGLGR